MNTAQNNAAPHRTLLSRLQNYFLTGLLVSMPLLLTIYLVAWVVQTMDSIVKPFFPDSVVLNYGYFPGYGLLVTLVGSTLIGGLMKAGLGRYFMRISEEIMSHMPVVRGIYTTLKQVSYAVLDQDSSSFREVALIEYPKPGIWALGFITGPATKEIQEKSGEEMVNIFVPTTPNPTSGFLLFMRREDITVLGMPVDDGIKMIVSLGVINPPYKKRKKEIQN